MVHCSPTMASPEEDTRKAEIVPAKRQRTEGTEPCASTPRFLSSYRLHMAEALEWAAIARAGVEPGARMQVRWTLGDGDDAEDVWWSCTITGAGDPQPDGRPTWRLLYDANPADGFDAEERDVTFAGALPGAVFDMGEGEALDCRREPVEEEDVGAEGDGDDIAATSVDEYFRVFTSVLTASPSFAQLSADRQRAFAECVQRSRPHFEREFSALARERGSGATVTGADIRGRVLPRVMPEVQAAFREVTAAAAGGGQ